MSGQAVQRRPATTNRQAAPVAEWRLEQLTVGQSASFDVPITHELIDAFVALTGDRSPLHTDIQFARRTRYRGTVAHGMLGSAFVSTLVGMHLPGRYATLLSHQIRYPKPVRAGDRLTVRGEITEKQQAVGRVLLQVSGINQHGVTVFEGEAEVLVNPPLTQGVTMAQLAKERPALDFSGQVVLVTGASRGIGQATAKLFAHHGAKVAVNYVQGRDDADAVVEDITSRGREAIAVQADVRDAGQVSKMVDAVVKRFGRIDILINNAMNQAAPQPFEQTAWDDVQADLDVALKGAFHSIQAVLPAMLKQGRGQVISVTTVYTNGTPPSGFSRYVAAKSALLGLTRSLAVEYAPKGIRFNVVSPGFTDTDLAAHVPELIKRKMAAEIPSGKIGEPLDIAKAIVVMASDYAGYVVGNQLLVCGGSTVL